MADSHSPTAYVYFAYSICNDPHSNLRKVFKLQTKPKVHVNHWSQAQDRS